MNIQRFPLTVKDVAEKFEVSEDAVRKWIQNNELRAIKLGKRWRTNEEYIEDFIKSRMNFTKDYIG